MKSGKYHLGTKLAIRSIRENKAKLVIISSNCPPLVRSEVEYYAMLGRVGVHHYNGNNIDLGTACGRLFRVSVMSVTDAGDSDILRTTAPEDAKPAAKADAPKPDDAAAAPAAAAAPEGHAH
eukprot:TRINITY_DN39_c0_g1_i1.p1 TRINITY_DN39_c0_g1~~TRINITY_DN39_c0_g1_i1.p1  ORF type:complete len:122 (+),score=50.50 TRINITY_DN39_c0_g1_i1:95-460(+)